MSVVVVLFVAKITHLFQIAQFFVVIICFPRAVAINVLCNGVAKGCFHGCLFLWFDNQLLCKNRPIYNNAHRVHLEEKRFCVVYKPLNPVNPLFLLVIIGVCPRSLLGFPP